MALAQQDKDCLEEYHRILSRPSGGLTEVERGHLDDILTGDEATRIAAAKYYAEFGRLVTVQAELAEIDQRKADLQAEETSLLAYIA